MLTLTVPSVPADPVLQVWSDSELICAHPGQFSESLCIAWLASGEGFVTYTADFSGKYEQVHFITAMDGERRRLEVTMRS